MMKLVVLALFVACASASSLPFVFQARGVVSPVDRCGGDGVPLQLRVSGCEGAPPCNIQVNTDYTVEGDFVPSQNSPSANFRLTAITSGGTIPVSDGSIGALSAGQTYTAGQTIRVSDALAGQTVTVRVEVYDVGSGRVEICVEAAMNVIN